MVPPVLESSQPDGSPDLRPDLVVCWTQFWSLSLSESLFFFSEESSSMTYSLLSSEKIDSYWDSLSLKSSFELSFAGIPISGNIFVVAPHGVL